MKRIVSILLTIMLVLSLAACGGNETADAAPTPTPAADATPTPAPAAEGLEALYESYTDSLPEMMLLDTDTMESFFGLDPALCKQAIAAIPTEGMDAEEIWLMEAVDADALKQLKQLADTRIKTKKDETINYLPDEFVLVADGIVVTEGNYLALLVAEDAETMKADFLAAVK